MFVKIYSRGISYLHVKAITLYANYKAASTKLGAGSGVAVVDVESRGRNLKQNPSEFLFLYFHFQNYSKL